MISKIARTRAIRYGISVHFYGIGSILLLNVDVPPTSQPLLVLNLQRAGLYL
jgi:hypothetical protein